MRAWTRCRTREALASILPLAAAVAGCRSDAVGPEEPSRLVVVGSSTPTAVAAAVSESLLEVRVETGAGSPVAGARVRFQPTAAGGFVDPPIAVTGDDGLARGSFIAGLTFGPVRVRADLPDQPSVPAAVFRVMIVPAGVFTLQRTGGDGQQIEVGSQAPRPLGARLLPDGSEEVADRPIVWELAAGTTGARLTADTVRTDEEGNGSTLLTVGREPGEHVVRAFAPAPFLSDTAAFRVTASAEIGTIVRIDSVRPAILIEGGIASVYGAGFTLPLAPTQVWVDGTLAVLTSQALDRVELVVPDLGDRCLPARRTGLRVLAGGRLPSNGVFVHLAPARPPLLPAPGEVVRLAHPELVRCVLFGAAGGEREVLLAVQSASRVDGARTPARLAVRSSDRVSGEPLPAPSAVPAPVAGIGDPAALFGSGDAPLGAWGDGEARLRDAVRRGIAGRAVRPSRSGGAGLAPSAGLPPAAGDTLRFAFAVDAATLGVSCTDTAAVVVGVVRRAGPRALLVEDVTSPGGGFTEAERDLLGRELEETTLPRVFEWFGEPADIDGNRRVIVLFTPQVNRLTPRGSGTLLGGFFLLLDLLDSGEGEGCPTSNEAEIVYLPVPDPAGEFSDPFLRDRAVANARSITVHEVQHLISAERRLLGGADLDRLEETWLAEGLSHIAEEVAGLAVARRRTGSELTLADFTASRAGAEAFRAFHFLNFARLRLHMASPQTTPALSLLDPLGLEGLQMRGFAWIFLRWLADRLGGDERTIFRRLAQGGAAHLVGIENVEEAAGRAWEELLGEFSLALAADDLSGASFPPALGVTTWNLRRTFAQLQAEPGSARLFPPEGYPLALTRLPDSTAGLDFDLGSSTTRYFSLGGSSGLPATALELVSSGGASLPESGRVQVVVGRVR